MTDQIHLSNGIDLDTREDIVINATQQPLVVLDKDLSVVMANASFYDTFQVTHEETEGTPIYDLGNGQWDIEMLQVSLENIIPDRKSLNDFEVTHKFEHIGEKVMLLSAREIIRQDGRQEAILLAIEDISQNKPLVRQTKKAEANINAILGKLVGSSSRFSGGTSPQSD